MMLSKSKVGGLRDNLQKFKTEGDTFFACSIVENNVKVKKTRVSSLD